MTTFDFDNRRFRAVSTDGNGDVTAGTEFHYRHVGGTVWATYGGGGIVLGMLIAVVRKGGTLDARYQHVNEEGHLMTGICTTTPELLPDGRLRLHETWRWTCGDESAGRSIVEELSPRGKLVTRRKKEIGRSNLTRAALDLGSLSGQAGSDYHRSTR